MTVNTAQTLKAIKYKNLDEARSVLSETGFAGKNLFDDGGAEPQGLLAVIPEDRLSEAEFYRLFEKKKGVFVEVQKIPYSGYGPPAEEQEYMGFISEKTAYVLKGCVLPIHIEHCPHGAQDIHHLEAMVMDYEHPMNREYLRQRLQLEEDWSFEDLFDLIIAGEYTAEEIDHLLHEGIQ
ncbi:MAG: hypothetical protein HY645_08080 [Acidobacteria bacterium]|nr:hypothetical protein [Acidobacteriota bacterium]